MAEGGDFPSIQGGSDADFEFTCTPCGEDGTREEAVKYCPECQEYLCATCTKYHRRMKTTKSHKLLDKDEANHDSTVGTTTIKAKCRYHPDRDIEMYCGTHDMVYCALCIATEHRSCNGVTKIDDESSSDVEEHELQRLKSELKSIHEQLLATNKNKEKNIESIEEQRNDILSNIQEVKRRIAEHLEKLEENAKQDLKTKYSEVKDELQSDIAMVTDMINEVEKTTKQFQMSASMDKGQRFVQMKLGQNTATGAKKLYDDNESNGTREMYFSENSELSTAVIETTSLGQVGTVTKLKKTTELRLIKMKSKKEVNLKMQSDKNVCHIIDVCQLQDGTIILADQNNIKLKRLDTHYNIKDHCVMDVFPMGVCCTGPNEVAVKMYNNKVQFISCGTSLSKLRDIAIEGGNQCGIAHCAGELWISTRSGVNVYNNSGTILKYIEKDPNGQKIFKSTMDYHMTTSKDYVLVTDRSDGVVCLGRDGTVREKLRDGRVNTTSSACVSNDGTVFLTGYISNNIVMFSGVGQCLGELVSADVGLKRPVSLCYDHNANCIIVTCHSAESIHIVELCN